MPGLAREFRAKAAAEFAAAEIATSDAARETHLRTARSYMTLADNEAWLDGERKQTHTLPPLPDRSPDRTSNLP
jgi:hypothetical protein